MTLEEANFLEPKFINFYSARNEESGYNKNEGGKNTEQTKNNLNSLNNLTNNYSDLLNSYYNDKNGILKSIKTYKQNQKNIQRYKEKSLK